MIFTSLLVIAELAALTVAVKALSATRAYISGEGVWSKAQKDAVYYLAQYAYSHNEKNYEKYLNFLKIPLSDKKARIALSKSPIDYAAAKQGFEGGKVDPNDIDQIIWLFTEFKHYYYMNKAIKIWEHGDNLIFELMKEAEQIHQPISSGNLNSKDILLQLKKIDQINYKLTENENHFSNTLAEGARWLEDIVLKFLITITLTIQVTGIILISRIGIRISRNIKDMNYIASKIANSDFSERVKIISNDELTKLSRSFNKMIDELADNERLKSEFISVLSHELRTPLMSIQGSLDLLNANSKDNSLVHKPQILIQIAQKNCARLIRLCNDILNVEKIESGDIDYIFKPINLCELLKDAFTLNKPYVESFQVKLKLAYPKETVVVLGEYDRLIQVLSNLISNATKYSPQGGEITISSILHTNHVEIAVADNGSGIPVAFQSNMFKKFAQASSNLSRNHNGTGLGLYICKTIIERHGGSISFKTEVNQGTTFYFTLPLAK